MTPKRWIIVGAVVLLLAGGGFVATKVAKGKIVGPTTPANEGGIVPGRAEDLAKAAGLEKSIYALARMIASEEGSGSREKKVAVAWVAKNEAAARRTSIFDLLVKSNKANGQFGAQHLGRYASTRLPPYKGDVEIAIGVISGAISDPTGGARKFYSPKAQDKLFADAKVPGYVRDAAGIEAKWQSEGWRKVAVAGIDARDVTFFRKA